MIRVFRAGYFFIFNWIVILATLFFAGCTPINGEPESNNTEMIQPNTTITAITISSSPSPVPTSTPTLNPSPTLTLIPTTTYTPTHTATAWPTPTPTIPLSGPLVAFQLEKGDVSLPIFIVDIGSETGRIVESDLIGNYAGFKWHKSGCLLETDLVSQLIDLQGNAVYRIPEDFDWDALSPHNEHRSYYARLSPDSQWMAYDIANGDELSLDLYISHEFNDVGIINMEFPEDPIFVTNSGKSTQFSWTFYESNGRAPSKFSWSKDSQWLVYMDVDDKGNRQIFRFSPADSTKEQLTDFNNQSIIFFPILSPDNRYLAVASYNIEERDGANHRDDKSGRLDIIDITNMSKTRIYLDGSNSNTPEVSRPFWIRWSADSQVVAIFGTDPVDEEVLIWLDATNGNILDHVSEDELTFEIGEHVYPAGSLNQFLILNENGDFYLFDRVNRDLSQLEITLPEHFLILTAEEAPFEFTGEENCSY